MLSSSTFCTIRCSLHEKNIIWSNDTYEYNSEGAYTALINLIQFDEPNRFPCIFGTPTYIFPYLPVHFHINCLIQQISIWLEDLRNGTRSLAIRWGPLDSEIIPYRSWYRSTQPYIPECDSIQHGNNLYQSFSRMTPQFYTILNLNTQSDSFV